MKEEKIKNKTELSVSFLKGNYPFRSYNSQLLPGWDLAACINILKGVLGKTAQGHSGCEMASAVCSGGTA